MTYVPKATDDIFVSYPLEAEDWAQNFEQDLKRELQQYIPATELRIFLAKHDWKLASSDEMLEHARNAAFFIATLVPGALAGDSARFFQLEWEAFRQSAHMFGSWETRFAPILIKPVSTERLRGFFLPSSDTAFWKHFDFYFEDKDGTPHSLSRDSRKSVYRKKIRELAWNIKKRLEQIKEGPAAAGGNQAKVSSDLFSGMKVLLGESEVLIAEKWEEVRRLLQNDGVEVISNGQYPDNEKDFEEFLKGELTRADLFVQLLSPLDEANHRAEATANGGAGHFRTRAQIAYDCAIAHLTTTSRPFDILQWRDTGVRREVLKYWPEELLDSAHVQAVGLEQFKRAIRGKLEDLSKPPPPPPPERPYLFIAADQLDLELAEKLSAVALDHADVDLMTDEDRKEHFTEAMTLAAAIIFVHGSASVKFVNTWLSAYVRAKAKLKRNSRLDALYRAPPRKKVNEEPHIPTRDLRILGSEELFTLDGIRQLCQELHGAAR